MNIINIAIDSDSLVHKACYRHQKEGGVDIERAYMEFCYEVGKVRSAVFRLMPYQKGDVVRPLIVLSPKKTFRHELSADYKIKRPKEAIHGVKQLKWLIMHRMGTWAKVVPNVEADDVVIYYAQHYNFLVSAIDKDVINACPTACYNYNTRSWGQPNSPYEIERWYAMQALWGDSGDGISGAKDVGEVRAKAWVEKYFGDMFSWGNFCEMFGSPEEAEIAMNLVRMDGLNNIDGKLVWKPWEPFKDAYWDM